MTEFDTSERQDTVPDYTCEIDGFINYQEKGRERYTYLFDTPEFDALAQTALEHRNMRQCQYLSIKKNILDIDKSEGLALDEIGKFIGQPRTLINFIVDPYFGFLGARKAQAFNVGTWYTLNAAQKGTVKTLSDEQYRRVLKARIIKNDTKNTRRDLVDVLMLLGGAETKINLYSTKHGVIQVGVTYDADPDGLVSYFLSKYMDNDSILPRQLGYRFTSVYEEITYLTSKLYPIIQEPESFGADSDIDGVEKRDVFINYEDKSDEKFEANAVIDNVVKKDIYNKYGHREEYTASADVDSVVKKEILKTFELYDKDKYTAFADIDSVTMKSIIVKHNLYDKERYVADAKIDSVSTTKVVKLEPYNITYEILGA